MKHALDQSTGAASTCALLLSDKSSGSSVLQSLLVADETVRVVPFTRHNENETLYWVKAAAILGLPQTRLINSELPMAPDIARRDLVEFLEKNLGHRVEPDDGGRWLFDGWLELCRRLAPVFLEKSPHHLHCWSSLELILACAERAADVEFKLIGLVRNPMDTLYSKWRRWRHLPEQSQYEWLRAYRNLLQLAELVGDRLRVVRYEDLVSDPAVYHSLQDHLGLATASDETETGLHTASVGRWTRDETFGFRLSPEVRACAVDLGYEPADIAGRSSLVWPLRRVSQSGLRRIRRRLAPLRDFLSGGER